MPFSHQVTKFTGHGGGTIFNTDICFWGKKIKTDNEREKKLFVPSLLLAANECHGVTCNG